MSKTKILLVVICAVFSFTGLFAGNTEKKVDLSNNQTINQLAMSSQIPVKKLAEFLEINISEDGKTKLKELGISNSQIQQAIDKFNEQKVGFSIGIVIVGMSVVFFSLILTGFIIAQIRHITHIDKIKEKKIKTARTTVKTSVGKVSGPQPDISTNAVVAAITALQLHIKEVDEQNKMLLTWRRTRLSMWKSYYKVMMPNREINQVRRGK